MSAGVQKSVMQEVLDLSHQFRENAAMRNGLPTRPARNFVEDEAPPERAILRLMRNAAEQSDPKPTEKTAAQTVVERVPAWIKGALIASTIGAGGLGGALLTNVFHAAPAAAPIVEITDEAEPTAGELLRWLSGEGYDRPPQPGWKP